MSKKFRFKISKICGLKNSTKSALLKSQLIRPFQRFESLEFLLGASIYSCQGLDHFI
jgi:hypothetical protein